LREYETTFIIQPEISDEGCQDLFARIDGILEREGAIRLLHDDQGKRKLAYEIRKFQKGRYVTTCYLGQGEAVAPLERTLRLEESVLRFLTVQVTDRVENIEQRKQVAAEEERIRAERARERAEREAEEERARREAAKLASESSAEREAEEERARREAAKLASESSAERDVDAEDIGGKSDKAEEEGENANEAKLEDSEPKNGGER
jgi:small subunit ribosomal protein S6